MIFWGSGRRWVGDGEYYESKSCCGVGTTVQNYRKESQWEFKVMKGL